MLLNIRKYFSLVDRTVGLCVVCHIFLLSFSLLELCSYNKFGLSASIDAEAKGSGRFYFLKESLENFRIHHH
jgi:hypothetical protein